MGNRDQALPLTEGRERIYQTCEDLQPARRIVIYPGPESFPPKNDVTAMPLPVAAGLIRDQS